MLSVGVSTFVETASTGPSRTGAIAGHEYGAVRVEPGGRIVALTGTSPHGQGTATTLAQVIADELGVKPEDITVIHGDTAVVPFGFGTGGSRAATVGGTAVLLAAQGVKDKARRIAAHLLEAGEADLEFEAGRFHVRGLADRGLGLAEIARVAHRGQQLPSGMDPGLEASRVYDPPDFTIPFGVYVAVVEVFPETGEVKLQRFIGVDDVGTVSIRCCSRASFTAASRRASPRHFGRRSSTTRPASSCPAVSWTTQRPRPMPCLRSSWTER